MRKVAVIGLDGATFDLIIPWIKMGKLPTFKRLMETGSYGSLESTIPPITAPAWSSFKTGVNPGKHGIYEFWKRKHDSYKLTVDTSLKVKYPAVWDILSMYDKKNVIINLPTSYPAREINGVMITGALTPDLSSKGFVFPEKLKKELFKEIPDYKIDPQNTFKNEKDTGFLYSLYHEIDMRKRTILTFMKKYSWDLFVGVFRASDSVQHNLWKYYDSKHPKYKINKNFRDGIFSVYKKIDQALDEITRQLPDDTDLIIVSDHGAGPLTKVLNINYWLYKNGYLKIKKTILSYVKLFLFKIGFTPVNVYNILSLFKLSNIKKAVRYNVVGRLLLKTLFLSFDDVDWSKTRAYAYGFVGEIYINLKGREPQGIVDRKDYKKTRKEISDKLQKITYVNEEKIINKIFYKEQIYKGDFIEDAPDIIFFPKDLEWLCSGDFEFTSNCLVYDPPVTSSGHHRMNGIFIANGEIFKKNFNFDKANIIDIAPTLLHILGLPVASHMDGRVIKEIFTGNFNKEYKIRYEDIDITGKRGKKLSEEEERSILGRLEDLGYMG